MILFLFLNLLNCCLLIIPEKITAIPPSDTGDSPKNCPCDLTYQTCDRNCECDSYCDDANNEYRKPGSHPFKNKYETLLPMCSDLDKSTITDLYNPLSIGYQILKRGLCLFKDTVNNDDDSFKNEDNLQFDIESLDSSINENIINFNSSNLNLNNSFNIYDNINITNFSFPIMLPDGSCHKKNDYIKFLQDKKVICYDKIEDVEKDIQNLKTEFTNFSEFFIENNTYLTNESKANYIIKKILIEFFVNNDESKIHRINDINILFIYEPKNNDNEIYKEVIYEVKFNSDNENITKAKSGNKGYIKGKPIITQYISNRVFSGVNTNGSCVEGTDNNYTYYEDDIIENTFTFEDNIIYGCKLNNVSNNNNRALYIYENIFKNVNFYPLGNPYLRDIELINYNCNNENDNELNTKDIISINILYEAINNKINIQNKLLRLDCYYNYNNIIYHNNQIKYKYIKINAFKVKPESEWWHAPGWKWFWPKNIMYPFRIGTTQYKEKN